MYRRVRVNLDGIEYETDDPARLAQVLRLVTGALRADKAERWSFGTTAGTELSRGGEWWFTGREDTTVEVVFPRHLLPPELAVPEVIHGR